MSLGETELPGQAGVADAGDRRCAGTTVVAADQDDIGAAFGNAGSNRADADFGNELDADPAMICWHS